jgi:hypothetical protein
MNSTLDIVCYGCGCIGGLILFVAPFSAKCRKNPRWIRVALWMSGPMAMGWGLLGYTLLFDSSLSPHGHNLVLHFKTQLSGMALGILLLLIFSGEFVPACWGRKS